MIKIGLISFPREVADEVAQCYSRFPHPPDQIRMIDTYVFNEDGKDIKAFSIFEYDEANEDIMMDYLKIRYEVFQKIPNLKSTVENWLRVSDAFEILEAGGDFNANFSM